VASRPWQLAHVHAGAGIRRAAGRQWPVVQRTALAAAAVAQQQFSPTLAMERCSALSVPK